MESAWKIRVKLAGLVDSLERCDVDVIGIKERMVCMRDTVNIVAMKLVYPMVHTKEVIKRAQNVQGDSACSTTVWLTHVLPKNLSS